jgi:hypothetical protein
VARNIVLRIIPLRREEIIKPEEYAYVSLVKDFTHSNMIKTAKEILPSNDPNLQRLRESKTLNIKTEEIKKAHKNGGPNQAS